MYLSRRPRNRSVGFTLVELLVVIGIIALLISILMPSLGRARQAALRTACLSNCRQLVIANQMYLNENKLTLPFTTWGDMQPNNVKDGWLYRPPLPGNRAQVEAHVETGSFWGFLKTRQVYRCPTHIKGEAGSFGASQTDAITSYLMNGAANGYGETFGNNNIQLYRIHKFKNDDVLFWEADERNGSAWNDASSYPWESFNPTEPGAAGLAIRHGKIAILGCFGGHAEWISHEEFYRLAAQTGKNRLWCSPREGSNGH